MIIFPLAVMLLVNAVVVGGVEAGDMSEGVAQRDVDNAQLKEFYRGESIADDWEYLGNEPGATVDWIYRNTDLPEHPPAPGLAGDPWEPEPNNRVYKKLSEGLAVKMQDVFNESPEDADVLICQKILDNMLAYGQDHGEKLPENRMRDLLEIDPYSWNEFKKLSGRKFHLTGNLFVGIFIGLAALVGTMGITFFGSGLDSQSIKISFEITAFTLIWTLMTGVGSSLIFDIPVLGHLLWGMLTFIYMGGVLQMITGD